MADEDGNKNNKGSKSRTGGFGMELFSNLDISGREERQENKQRRTQMVLESKANDILAARLYRREIPFTIAQFERALDELKDKKFTKLGWRDTRLVRDWLKLNLFFLEREREREIEDNFRIKFKRK